MNHREEAIAITNASIVARVAILPGSVPRQNEEEVLALVVESVLVAVEIVTIVVSLAILQGSVRKKHAMIPTCATT